MNQAYYKKYARENRIQTSEATFGKGMRFTRAPLEADEVRLLVNYDITSEGSALTVRDGLRCDKIINPASEITIPSGIATKAFKIKDIATEDNINHKLILNSYIDSTTPDVSGTNLRNITTAFLDYQEGSDEYIVISDTDQMRHYIPKIDKINGLEVTDKRLFARPVGCFAWEGNYYSFDDDGKVLGTIYNNNAYAIRHMDPKTITPLMASGGGYNMLLQDPYSFSNAFTTGSILFDGPMYYDADTNRPASALSIDRKYKVVFYYKIKAGVKYKFKISIKSETEVSWATLKEQEVQVTEGGTIPEVSAVTSFTNDDMLLKLEAFKYEGSEYQEYAENSETYTPMVVKDLTATTANLDLPNYDLSKCSGFVYWNKYTFLYGCPEAPNTLFRSAINEPTYYPYPSGGHIFDDPIVACVPFNENLLVFTTTQILQLTLATAGYTIKILQNNMHFTDFDATMIQVVKNMLFFKSGDYYYMIVPKTLSLNNDYALAPISKNIEQFLDNFQSNVKEIISIVYDYTDRDLELIDHYNYLNYEDIHNIYVFNTDEGVYFNLDLLYNTVDRNWRIYTYESPKSYIPVRQDATNTAKLFMINGTKLIFIDKDPIFATDNYGSDIEIKFPNYQFIDTGYRNNDVDHNKRFRELQFKFNNIGNAILKFYMDFVLDGETRHTMYKYATEYVSDRTDPNYGLLYISRISEEDIDVPGSTVLGANDTDINAWELDYSRFSEVVFWKARIRVSGKGYAPRTRLLCRHEEKYEILGYTWVYRNMYSR